jgi:hypothetical protein
MRECDYDDALGPVRFMPWSKRNAIWTCIYRTTKNGRWDKDDVDEFNSCDYIYEIHFQHDDEDRVHLMALEIMRRRPEFKAAKVSVLAVNDMKVVILLGKGVGMSSLVANVAKANGAELARVLRRDEAENAYDTHMKPKVQEYVDSLRRAFAPTMRGQ